MLKSSNSAASHQDIRAVRPRRWLLRLQGQWQRTILLVFGDMLALAIAWRFADFLNDFYSPIAPQLVWWVWFDIPSLFWVFSVITLIFFFANHLYRIPTEAQNYTRAARIITLVYCLFLLGSYFYDPQLDPPRSLFLSAWLFSIIFVLGFRLILTLILRQFDRRSPPIHVFLIAPAHKLHRLAQLLRKRPHYNIVGAALASTRERMKSSCKIFQKPI
jgi:FlaA1/EpsC-like NDP-sugar epimerase